MGCAVVILSVPLMFLLAQWMHDRGAHWLVSSSTFVLGLILFVFIGATVDEALDRRGQDD